MRTFERVSLGVIGVFVFMLISLALYDPPKASTVAPRASVAIPEAAPAPPDGEAEDGEELLAYLMPHASAQNLSDTFSVLDYDLDSILAGDRQVPRLFLVNLPNDLANVRETERKKALFFRTVLPLILQVNEELFAERERLWALAYRQRMGMRIDATDKLWLIVMAERYDVPAGDIEALLSRVDVIPPSLALAQAAEESGWGTSRFAREGNAIFGQWTFGEDGHLVPLRRPAGATYQVRAFQTLLDSAKAYAFNLNSHRAYAEFRHLRGQLRRQGTGLSGAALARTLEDYAERGDYARSLLAIIEANELEALDESRLIDFRPDFTI